MSFPHVDVLVEFVDCFLDLKRDKDSLEIFVFLPFDNQELHFHFLVAYF